MVKHSIITLAFLVLAVLATFINALPTPLSKPQPFRFDVSTPKTDTLWLVDSLPVISWDAFQMPEGSTMDIALLNHERKVSILLRRYVPTRLGSTLVNLRPEITSGTYSLLLTVFKGRTSTVIGRSLVQSVILVDNESEDPELEAVHGLNSLSNVEDEENMMVSHKPELVEFNFKKTNQNAIQETEVVELTHQPTKGNLVLLAPYTIGWTIPKALETARRVQANILLVNRNDEVVKELATKIDAKVGFIYVFLPEDTPLQTYKIKIEIIGKGRKFSGITRKFGTSLPAFLAKK